MIWAARGWPLVVRRRSADDRPDRVPLGLPLPPSCGKRRIAVDLDPHVLGPLCSPPLLAEIRHIAPANWHPTIDALLALAREYAVDVRVFGSFAWQTLTGLDYISAGSDLDLLWPLTPRTRQILPRIASLDATAPGRLDGEVEGDGAVNWRELASGSAEVLVKSCDGVALMPTDQFMGSIEKDEEA